MTIHSRLFPNALPHEAGAPRGTAINPGPRRAHLEERAEQRSGPFRFVREVVGLVLVAFLLALLIKTFLVQAFFIPSGSMEKTLEVGDRVLVNKVVYHFRQPRRGDIIVFEDPNETVEDRGLVSELVSWVTEGLGLAAPPEKDFIKRVVALPGEVIELHRGNVFIDGKRIQQTYPGLKKDRAEFGPFEVEPGQYFVMGDNRANSMDSRTTTLGTIPADKIVGRAFIILWPPKRFEWLARDS